MPGVRDTPQRIEERLIVALDVPDVGEARRLVRALSGAVAFFKLGLWLIYAAGFERLLAELVESGNKVFLDAKMFDIGETVRHGVARAAERGVSFLTVHGDRDIMRAAVAGRGNSPLKIFAITVLTSIEAGGLHDLGHACTIEELVRLRARVAAECGVDGLIAAPTDRPDEIRREAGSERLLIATPGVRLAATPADDQKRTGTPAQAIAAGADYLVVGRPIIRAADPAAAAAAIIADMRRGLR
jgi:orotidine-5'-phosphate decarboxylase